MDHHNRDFLRAFTRIGLLSFGGPAAQIAVMHRELVEERDWLSEQQFLSALSFCMLLPGPEAMQLTTYCGWRLRGVSGGIVAGLLFVIPGIYLMYAYMFAMPLIVEKKMGAWHALETSRKAVSKVWFRFFGFVWLLMLINAIAAIPLGLGWIWTLPWSVLAFAMVYIKMFGAEVHTLAD